MGLWKYLATEYKGLMRDEYGTLERRVSVSHNTREEVGSPTYIIKYWLLLM